MLKTALPDSGLRSYVRRYWEVDYQSSAEFSQHVFPTGLPEISFYIGELPHVNGRKLGHVGLLSGQTNSPSSVQLKGKVTLFSIAFEPHGLGAFVPLL